MKHPVTRALYRYWDRLRAGRSAPERNEFEPAAISAQLGDVFLLDMGIRDHHTVRLAGTRICALIGREWKGHAFAEPFAEDDRTDICTMVEGVAASAIPAVAGIAGETEDGHRLDLELQLLPLRHRGRTHARQIGSLVALELPYWAGVIPLERMRLVSVRHIHVDMPGDEIDLVTPAVRPAGGRLRVLPGGRA